MTVSQSELVTLNLPVFGLPGVEPAIPARVYRERMTSFHQRAHDAGYGAAIVYGDREHFANLTYLTGYDPRFEEAMLVVDLNGGGKPLLVVGNEGYGYVPISPVADDFEVVLFQSFSLLGQDRSRSRLLYWMRACLLAISGQIRGALEQARSPVGWMLLQSALPQQG
jgi:hypothetical protein